jgi:hypothetical protein
LSPTGSPIEISDPQTFDAAVQRCTSEGPKLSWTIFQTLGAGGFWADPLAARVTCYVRTHRDDGKERKSGQQGFVELVTDLLARPAKDTDPCMLFRGLRFAGVIAAKEDCTGANELVARTLWDAYKVPLREQSWAANAGNASQVESLRRLFERPEADGLIDIAGIFAIHRKWPLERTVGLVGPTIVEAMTERFRLLGRSSYGDYGLAPLPANSVVEAKAQHFRDQWKDVVAAIGLPSAPGSGEADTHAAARAFVRYQLRHSVKPEDSSLIQDTIGTMAQDAAAMTGLAAAAIQAEVAALAP